MTLPTRRPQTGYMVATIVDPLKGSSAWGERESISFVRELIRRHSDLPSYVIGRFRGPKAQTNALWREYRNYILQGLSYFDAASSVRDRSACLLLYYALMNFAKAELLVTNPSLIVGKRVAHGLSFDPIKARKVTSDALLAKGGVFSMLYQNRVGRPLPVPQRLPIERLLRNISELGTQLRDVGFGSCAVIPLFHVVAIGATSTWPVISMFTAIESKSSTGKLFLKVFRPVETNKMTWREEFSISRRAFANPITYESIDVAPRPHHNFFNSSGALAITWRLKDILSPSVSFGADGLLTPSLYSSKLLPMPASLARYATIYYASSLVRYRPSMFDERSTPENAYLFDAIARECALPILVDALNGLEGRTQMFHDDESFRA
jgi:hypothetical protein